MKQALPILGYAVLSVILFDDLRNVIAYQVSCNVCWITACMVFGFGDYE